MVTLYTTTIFITCDILWAQLIFHKEVEDALCCGRNTFGAYGNIDPMVAEIVIPCSIIIIHVHAVLAIAPVWPTRVPVCERAAPLVHQGVILHPPVMRYMNWTCKEGIQFIHKRKGTIH